VESDPAVRQAAAPQGQAPTQTGEVGANKKPALPIDRKVIYTATVKVEVEDFPKAEEALLRLIEEHKAQLEKSEATGSRGSSRTGYWKVRIAPGQLAAFRKAVLKLGEAEQNNLDSQEVTEEYYDLEVRIKNQEARVARIRERYKDAKSFADLDTNDEKLAKATDDLDRLRGRKEVLENLTTMTTVHVHLRERGVYVPEESPDFGTSVGRTFSMSLGALGQFGKWLVLVLVALVPWLPVLLAISLPFLIWWRRSKRPTAPTAVVVQGAPPSPPNPTP
jgi:hypothetical protein